MKYLEIVCLFGAGCFKTAENASKMTTDAVEQGMLLQRQLVLLRSVIIRGAFEKY